MSPCKRTLSLSSAYVERELNAAERAQVDEHLALCPTCRTEIAAVEQTIAALRALPTVDADDLFADRVFRKIEAIEADGRRASRQYALPRPDFSWGWLRPALAGAAAVLVLFGIEGRLVGRGKVAEQASMLTPEISLSAPTESAGEQPNEATAPSQVPVADAGVRESRETKAVSEPSPGENVAENEPARREGENRTLAEVLDDPALSPYDGTAVSLNSNTNYVVDVYRYQPSNGASPEVRRVATVRSGTRRAY